MAARFNPAPGWPPAPVGWVPSLGWTHPPDWPTTPPGWQFWVDDITGEPVSDPTLRSRPWFTRKRVLIPVLVPVGVVTILLGAGLATAGEPPGGWAAPGSSVHAPTEPADGPAADAASEASEAAAANAAEAEIAEAAAAAAKIVAAAEAAAIEAAAAEAAAARAAAVWTVTRIVDGDTIDVSKGDLTERVRVIGMDTPERGECGYDASGAALAALVLGQPVVLSPGAGDDRDRYDRVLRYVDRESDSSDAGLALIDAGHAIARYDSRDGYGTHPREGAYVTADEASPQAAEAAACAAASPPPPAPAPFAPAPAPPAAPAPHVAPAPAPAIGAHANCDAVRAAVADPIRTGDPGWAPKLDRDGDGVGCE